MSSFKKMTMLLSALLCLGAALLFIYIAPIPDPIVNKINAAIEMNRGLENFSVNKTSENIMTKKTETILYAFSRQNNTQGYYYTSKLPLESPLDVLVVSGGIDEEGNAVYARIKTGAFWQSISSYAPEIARLFTVDLKIAKASYASISFSEEIQADFCVYTINYGFSKELNGNDVFATIRYYVNGDGFLTKIISHTGPAKGETSSAFQDYSVTYELIGMNNSNANIF